MLTRGGRCGYSPVKWSAERLQWETRVLSAQAMVWVIGTQGNPSQAKRLIGHRG